jgi:hypothetical protein
MQAKNASRITFFSLFKKLAADQGSAEPIDGQRACGTVTRFRGLMDISNLKQRERQAVLMIEWIALIWSLLSRIPRVRIYVGLERRPDNVQVMRDFIHVDVVNESLFSVTLTDVSITYRNPYRRVSVKSIIVAEEQPYPLLLRPRERLRLNLLPSLADLPRIDFIAATLDSGREFRLKSKAAPA